MMEGERAARSALAFRRRRRFVRLRVGDVGNPWKPFPNGTVRFLVMSNNVRIKQEMLSRFDDSVVTMTGELERGSQRGMEFAALSGS